VAIESGSFDPCSSTEDGLTLLHVASQNGQTALADLLLKYGADANACATKSTRRGKTVTWTPLDFATRFRYQGIVRLLHAAGAQPTRDSTALDPPQQHCQQNTSPVWAVTHRDAHNLKPLSFADRLTLEGVLGLTPRGSGGSGPHTAR
jgi:ankyrin repeat protein